MNEASSRRRIWLIVTIRYTPALRVLPQHENLLAVMLLMSVTQAEGIRGHMGLDRKLTRGLMAAHLAEIAVQVRAMVEHSENKDIHGELLACAAALHQLINVLDSATDEIR